MNAGRRNRSLKMSKDPTGNRTRNLLCYGVVHQPTAPPLSGFKNVCYFWKKTQLFQGDRFLPRLFFQMALPDTFVATFHDEDAVRKMRYNVLGNTGLRVSHIAFGGGPLGGRNTYG
jgi:hypothetical protein